MKIKFIKFIFLAGSEGDLASSSEGDDISRRTLSSCHKSGQCSPFTRRQLSRDSGCFDDRKTLTRKLINFDTSKLARENNFNSLISINKCTDVNILSEVCGKEDYDPNIPNSVNSNRTVMQPTEEAFDKSPQSHNNSGIVKFVAKSDNLSESVLTGNDKEADSTSVGKIAVSKYIVGTSSDLGLVCDSANAIITLGQKSCLSEKSSDSGVSSSSISSVPLIRDNKTFFNTVVDSPTKTIKNLIHGTIIVQGSTPKSSNNQIIP